VDWEGEERSGINGKKKGRDEGISFAGKKRGLRSNIGGGGGR